MFAYSDVTFYYGPIRAASGLWSSVSHPRTEAEKPRLTNIVNTIAYIIIIIIIRILQKLYTGVTNRQFLTHCTSAIVLDIL